MYMCTDNKSSRKLTFFCEFNSVDTVYSSTILVMNSSIINPALMSLDRPDACVHA